MNTVTLSIVTLIAASALSFNALSMKSSGATAVGPSHADTTIDWEHMSKAERKQYMKDVVMPKMKPIFHDFDPKRFKDVRCTTCHGDGARNGDFKMPNPELPKLPATREGFDKLNKEKPKMMEFMSKTVKPTMADLLGMKPFDPKTGSGFSCGNCHTTAKK